MDYTEDFFESIEHRNAEFNSLYYGADYLRGQQVNNLLRVIKKLDVQFLVDAVRFKIANKKFRKFQKRRRTAVSHKVSTYASYQRLRDKKIVVYTCITGGYDALKEPLLSFDNVEYICFTEDAARIQKAENTKWAFRQIPAHIAKEYDRTLSNRYIKMHPKELFPDADYAVYVDGNIGIQSFLGTYLLQTKAKTGTAIFAHSQRQCAYVEANVCISRRKGSREAIERQMHSYEKAGFPQNFGLYECTIIATDLTNTLSAELLEHWWQEFVHSKSCRDQLSLPYVVWKLGMRYTDIGLLGENLFDDSRITVYSH